MGLSAAQRKAQAHSQGSNSFPLLTRVFWEPTLEHSEPINLECTTLHKRQGTNAWTSGTLLPKSGRYSWRCRIDHSYDNTGKLLLGVCDHAGTFALCLAPCTGLVHVIPLRTDVNGRRRAIEFDTHDGTRTLVDVDGKPLSLRGRADGMVVEVLMDVDNGGIAFRAGAADQLDLRTESLHVLPWILGLPKEPMRPCVGLWRAGDQVTLIGRGIASAKGFKLQQQRNRKRALRSRREGELRALVRV